MRTRRTRASLVGAAALVDDGRVVTGCNVENASVRRDALCAGMCGLVSALHASGGDGWSLARLPASTEPARCLTPCGRCRQLIWEHGGAECLVDTPAGICADAVTLLPQAFGPDDLALGSIVSLDLDVLQAFPKVSLA
mgnify:CR=1 FL=1